MGFLKNAARFSFGGAAYVGLEMLWRGRSHSSMFLAGGTCFLLLGELNRRKKGMPAPARWVAGAGIITCVELVTGLVANKNHQVWDYRKMPLNVSGQICLPYTLLWIPVSMGAMALDDRMKRIWKET